MPPAFTHLKRLPGKIRDSKSRPPEVPKNLTIRIRQIQDWNSPDSVCRAFPAHTGRFNPVFPHLSDPEQPKRLLKNLTFGRNGRIERVAEQPIWASRNNSPFGDERKLPSPIPRSETVRNVTRLPQSLTLSAGVPRIKAKTALDPVKPHLRFAFSPVSTHQRG